MTRDTLKMTTLAAMILAVPTLSFAQLSLGDVAGTTETEIRTTLEASGAVIQEFESEDGMIEVEYTLAGAEFEVTVDPASGKVIEIENEEDDDDDSEEDED
jgi:hypothetical protein